MYTIKCDTHTHTLYSRHAFSTIEENVRAAAEQGMELLASTDHFSDMLYPEVHIRHYQYLFNQSMMPRVWHGVTLLRGCEADIIDLKGHLFGYGFPVDQNIVGMAQKKVKDLDRFVMDRQDYVIASVHGDRYAGNASVGQVTDMYVKALEDKKVLILGHIGRSGLSFDTDALLLEAKAKGKLIELNEHSFGSGKEGCIPKCRKIAERCAELGVKISIGTDAHISYDVGKFAHVLGMLEEIHFPEELIASRDKESFLKALEDSGVGVPELG